jgi:hypothetical protein
VLTCFPITTYYFSGGKVNHKSSIVKTKCAVNFGMRFLHEDVLPRLNNAHAELLAHTPFFHLLGFPMNAEINRPLLHHILLNWDVNEQCLKLKSRTFELCPSDISLILGLPTVGDVVNVQRKGKKVSILRNKYFPKNGEIKRAALKEKILVLLKEEGTPPEDIVGMIIMWIFTTVLFPHSSGTCPAHLFYYVDNVQNIRKYSWAKAVYDVLVESIQLCAPWVQSVEREGIASCQKRARKNDPSKGKMQETMNGCTHALYVIELSLFTYFVL